MTCTLLRHASQSLYIHALSLACLAEPIHNGQSHLLVAFHPEAIAEGAVVAQRCQGEHCEAPHLTAWVGEDGSEDSSASFSKHTALYSHIAST